MVLPLVFFFFGKIAKEKKIEGRREGEKAGEVRRTTVRASTTAVLMCKPRSSVQRDWAGSSV